jgi:predicted Zn-dependent protease
MTAGLFDQSALSTLAQRLVEAARRAGADAADAVAVRGVSQGVEVRDGRVEESERSKATMSDCACWSGSARPWFRPTMFPATAWRNWPSAR